MELGRGRFLIKLSGIYTCSIAQMGSSDKVTFTFAVDKEKQSEKTVRMNSYSGYSYPYSFEDIVEGGGELCVSVNGSFNGWNMSNVHMLVYSIA